ncbi:molecular chaperone (small heat shock protein) [Desulfosporosinus orientis DSM 765]|uniref:Molecular chaperone (Small heat shock protein) n=1 Tax=Desulfosporosinus orientis (strain ATCC 19365 / DSM 765 / NCIMB 8382 / VKM B-1628 / Singapore I) TaxID=768706 RepID=G7WE91_DESOD|nr:Hsp20/alpha crystallin family protein [Desulfosporosinus orientis]AET70067.1 molecular chaperone (small heat shock protein) [Desulfosporosinus orientis DSM 765]
MSLIPREPYRMFEPFWNEMDRLMRPERETASDRWYRVDIEETQNKVLVTAEIPGIEKAEDLSITLDENRLLIQGEIRKTTFDEEEWVSHHSERYCGKFSRALTLPAMVKTDGAQASYKNGLLKLSFLKDPHPAARRIDVDFH